MEPDDSGSDRQTEQEQQTGDVSSLQANEPAVAEPERTQTPQESQGGRKPVPTLARLWARVQWLTVLQVAGVLAASGAVLVAYWQFEALKRTNELAERGLVETQASNERAQRAWVFPDESQKMQLQPDTEIDYTMVIQNFGPTPAHEIRSSIWATVNTVEPDPTKLKPPEAPTMFLASQAKGTVATRIKLTPDQIRLIDQKKVRLFVYGLITYRDDFGRDRVTYYCRYYDPKTVTHFANCLGGNHGR